MLKSSKTLYVKHSAGIILMLEKQLVKYIQVVCTEKVYKTRDRPGLAVVRLRFVVLY